MSVCAVVSKDYSNVTNEECGQIHTSAVSVTEISAQLHSNSIVITIIFTDLHCLTAVIVCSCVSIYLSIYVCPQIFVATNHRATGSHMVQHL